jgi:hypothetical protein
MADRPTTSCDDHSIHLVSHGKRHEKRHEAARKNRTIRGNVLRLAQEPEAVADVQYFLDAREGAPPGDEHTQALRV